MQGIYQQRRPELTPLYQLIRDYFETFRDTYDERYGDTYGFFRGEIDAETNKYQKCGIPKFGFARVRCTAPGCGESYLLPFSCHSRSFCPSCMQKHMLETGDFIVHTVAEEVPHRHIVFTIPKLMRKKKSNEASVNEFEQLARYIAKPHFSLEAMEYVKETGKVIYHGSMHPGKRRNFEIFDACDFLAAVTSHIPKKRQKYISGYTITSHILHSLCKIFHMSYCRFRGSSSTACAWR